MICVSIACGSHKRMIAEQTKLAEDGVKLVELRLDFLRKPPELGRLIPNRPTPVIATARRKTDGGLWNYDEERRLILLRSAIIEGVDYVDLEMDVATKIPRYGKTKRIISYHDFNKTPDLDALYEKILRECDPDLIKLAVTAETVGDLFRIFDFLKKMNGPDAKVPVILFSMGELGFPTRILGKKYGVPFTYATFSEKRIIAPGILPYQQLRDHFQYDRINSETEVYGVIADPIAHSLSPLIHNACFKAHEMNRVYLPFRVPAEGLTEFIERAPEIGIKGLSVTIPHKSAVIPKLTRCDPAVEEIDACNTLVYQGKDLFGYNTDYLASVLSIETAMGGGKNGTSPLTGKQALVLGAGGAAKAVAYGLKEKGALVTITDRNPEKAKKVAEGLECNFCDWEARGSYVVSILANCTSVGMFPNVDAIPIDKSAIRGGMFVFDAVYNPENTLLLRTARQKGAIPISGLEMFIGQACLQFKLFTGEKASARLMRGLLKDALSMTKS